MTIRRLRARLDRLALSIGTMPGKDRDRDRRRREELFYRKLAPQGPTGWEKAELLSLDALFKDEDRDRNRSGELAIKRFLAEIGQGDPLTESEEQEVAEHERRYPP